MDKNTQDYIGDGVYVKYDGWGIWLKANDPGQPTDEIYLEPDMLARLNEFAERINERPTMAPPDEEKA